MEKHLNHISPNVSVQKALAGRAFALHTFLGVISIFAVLDHRVLKGFHAKFDNILSPY